MAIVAVARDHMPVQMRDGIAQAREVHLARGKKLAQRRLGGEHRIHQPGSLGRCEIGHFLHVPLQHDPAKARVVGIIDEHDAAESVAPEHVPSRGSAQLAGLIVQVFIPRRQARRRRIGRVAAKNSRIGPVYGPAAFEGGSAGTALSGKMSR